MANLEEILESMDSLVKFAETEDRSLTDEEVTKYEGLEKDLQTAKKAEEVSKRNAAYQTPRVVIHAAKAKGEDAEYAQVFDQYLRTGRHTDELIQTFAQSEGTTTAGGFLVNCQV